MKKIASLLMAVLMLCTMLTVLAIPAFAAEKQIVKVPDEAHLHYTGKELTAFKDNDIYTVYGNSGKKTDCGEKYALLYLRDGNSYKWEGIDGIEAKVRFEVHQYFDRDKNGLCDECGKVDRNFKVQDSYLDVKLSEDNSVITEETTRNDLWIITEEDKAWGTADADTWYVCTTDMTLNNRVNIVGKVHLIIKDGCTLTAKNGIHLKEGNTLSVYAQSNGEAQGKLVANGGDGKAAIGGNGSESCGTLNVCGAAVIAEGNGTAGIGGGNGWNGADGRLQSDGGDVKEDSSIDGTNGTAGGNGGTVNVYAGTVTAKGSVGIGGGNGGIGGRGNLYSTNDDGIISYRSGKAGKSGNGGNGSNITVYGGTVNASGDTLGIGGGKGGKGNYDIDSPSNCNSWTAYGQKFQIKGEIYKIPDLVGSTYLVAETGGDGGNGGNGGTLTVKGGTVQLHGKVKAAGGGECGGTSAKYKGNGNPGSDTTFDLENCVLKAGESAESTTILSAVTDYTNQKYFSVQYNTVSFIGSVLSNGNVWIIAAVAVIVLGGIAALVIVRKKKKTA